jgi:hypothetical protein
MKTSLTFPPSTHSRKTLTTTESFIAEPDSRAQCVALEENVKEFGITYFGMKDRRQGHHFTCADEKLAYISSGIVHIIGPEQGFTVLIFVIDDVLQPTDCSSQELLVFVETPIPPVSRSILCSELS